MNNLPSKSPNGNTEYNVKNAALLGASSAFGKKKPAPPPTGTKGNGALTAATLAGNKRPSANAARSPSASSTSSVELNLLRVQTTGSSLPPISTSPSSFPASSPGLLDVPPDFQNVSRSKSPSNIAATLAAARHLNKTSTSRPTSPTRQAPDTLLERPRISRTSSLREVPLPGLAKPRDNMDTTRQRRGRDDRGTDESPIPSTTSLVKMFEQSNVDKGGNGGQIGSQRAPPAVRGPKPTSKPKLPAKPAGISGERDDETVDGISEPHTPERTNDTEQRGRPVTAVRRQPSNIPKSPTLDDAPPVKPKPELPPPRRVTKKADQDQEPVKSPPLKSRPPQPPPKQLRRPASNPALVERSRQSSLAPPLTQYQQRSIRQISPHITGDSLANAIVGANLASRGTSPSRSSTPALPPRRNHHHHDNNPLHRLRSRSTSPTKGKPVQLRTTMRKDAESSSDEGRGKHGRGRKHFMRKHPNKHHEGSRKRWRDRITERERKRYEGVWAANKGLWVQTAQSTSDTENDVLDLVVRDIWNRSRLPASMLEEIWLLVDRRGVRRLTREEFVVGLWLIDQSLKGRKLPARVMESVWASVRLMGVKVKKKNFQ